MVYYIVNYDWNTRYPKEFYTIREAKKIFKKIHDGTYTLEGYNFYNYKRRHIMGKKWK